MAVSWYNTSAAANNSLALAGWGNGSISTQIPESRRVYAESNHSNLLYLTMYPNNWASLTYWTNATYSVDHNGLTAKSLSFPLVTTLFDSDRTQLSVNCMYPLSGQYATLPRALFYTLIVFSLVFRRHAWISVAALGTAMTYSGVAAIHLFALVGSYKLGYPGGWDRESTTDFLDVDFQGIAIILMAAGIMLTPI
jgi:hypothetical protein